MELVRSARLWLNFMEINGYHVDKCVGQGSFGDVYAVKCIKTGQPWAVKRLVARRDIRKDCFVRAEIASLATIRHPTVVRLHEVLLCTRMACLVMELAPLGNLEMLVLRGCCHVGNQASLFFHIDCDDSGFGKQDENLHPGGKHHRRRNLNELTHRKRFAMTSLKDNAVDNDEKKASTETLFKICDDSLDLDLGPDCDDTDWLDMEEDYLDLSPPDQLPTGETNNVHLNPVFLVRAFTQATSALAFIHDLDLAHRDINPSNVLVFSHDLVKLADFGLCFRCRREVKDGLDSSVTDGGSLIQCCDFLGHERYQAPEIRQRLPFYARPADVWSLGGLLFFMLCHDHPPLLLGDLHLDLCSTLLETNISLPDRDNLDIELAPHDPHRLQLRGSHEAQAGRLSREAISSGNNLAVVGENQPKDRNTPHTTVRYKIAVEKRQTKQEKETAHVGLGNIPRMDNKQSEESGRFRNNDRMLDKLVPATYGSALTQKCLRTLAESWRLEAGARPLAKQVVAMWGS